MSERDKQETPQILPTPPFKPDPSVSEGHKTQFKRSTSQETILTKLKDSEHKNPKKDEEVSEWVEYRYHSSGEIRIHAPTFNQLGIVIFNARHVEGEQLATQKSFTFGSRTLTFGPEEGFLKDKSLGAGKTPKAIIKTRTFLDTFQTYADQRCAESIIEASTPADFKVSSDKTEHDPKKTSRTEELNTTAVINSKRHAEIFLPFSIMDKEHKQIGMHVYPWVSSSAKKSDHKFAGCREFVTAMCMFGSSLKALVETPEDPSYPQMRFPLIKHNIRLYPSQQITGVEADGHCPYKFAQFEDLKRLASLICHLSPPGVKPTLRVHLPYHDYSLFLISHKMSLEVFTRAIDIIVAERNEYIDKITEILTDRGITPIITSPFDKLFGGSQASKEQILKTFCTIMDAKDKTQLKEKFTKHIWKENKLVEKCLTILSTPSPTEDGDHETWQIVIKNSASILRGKTTIDTLEELFELGNTVIQATATKNKGPYEVISLLPLSEKQISIGYQRFEKQESKTSGASSNFAPITNFTYLDAYLGYSPGLYNKGSAFYFDSATQATQSLFEKGLLEKAMQNASTSEGSEDHTSLTNCIEHYTDKPIASSHSEASSPIKCFRQRFFTSPDHDAMFAEAPDETEAPDELLSDATLTSKEPSPSTSPESEGFMHL
jgi:hypothetical protein